MTNEDYLATDQNESVADARQAGELELTDQRDQRQRGQEERMTVSTAQAPSTSHKQMILHPTMTMAEIIQDEPLLRPDPHRFVLFPIQYDAVRLVHVACPHRLVEVPLGPWRAPRE